MARGKTGARLFRGLCAIALVVSMASAGEAVARETVLYRFQHKPSGFNPGGLTSDSAGVLYGTTSSLGPLGEGTVFRLTPPAAGQGAWTLDTLFGFKPGADAAYPEGNLVIDKSGAIYGTTSGGGKVATGHKYGWGTVFKLSPPSKAGGAWTESVLHALTLNHDGAGPGGLVMDSQGALYAVAATGGPNGFGTVFKLTPPTAGQTEWSETTLHAFQGKLDGSAPYSNLVRDQAGALYGTTADTGSAASPQAGTGSVFKLTPPATGRSKWTFTTLHSFSGGTDGAGPNSLAIGWHGAVYGVTSDYVRSLFYGYGTVFRLRPPGTGHTQWTMTTLYSFTGQGEAIGSGLVFSKTGSLFGTTYFGGTASPGNGTVFRLDLPALGGATWAEQTLYTFKAGTDGALPTGGLVVDRAGTLYGMTDSGGGGGCRFDFKNGSSVTGCGTVYRLTP
jgi:hypothetical protein